MITFKNIKWKNFLSTGDYFNEIQLDREKSTLIVGGNGAGKSTMLDAISFVLFGRSHRDIKRAQLINSINKKGTVVEIDFNIGSTEFKVVRGIKPNIFEIYQNGIQINQDSNARNFQKFLETNILGLNHKSFHQIVVLGSSSFIPFMQLQTYQRREIIEDLLDINIFSKMNTILRERTATVKDSLKDVNYNYDLIRDKIKIKEDNIKYLKSIIDENAKCKTDELNVKHERIADLQKATKNKGSKIKKALVDIEQKINNTRDSHTDVKVSKNTIMNDIKKLMNDAKFFKANDVCPTCTQSIDASLKKEKLKVISESGLKLDKDKKQLEQDLQVYSKNLVELNTKNDELLQSQQEYLLAINEIEKLLTEIENINSKKTDTSELDKVIIELEDIKKERDDMFEIKTSINEDAQYLLAVSEMLKDSGIKTKIIKQYLPVMNKLINNYLQVLEFFISFHLDENFDEVIKSRHRDEFKYASFSEGEKQRIDLSLLFTWRNIAKMKNSVSTNLLILDETFDSSLDADGVENLTKILSTLGHDTNTFIISHKRDELEGRFRSKIEFVKEQNFSRLQ